MDAAFFFPPIGFDAVQRRPVAGGTHIGDGAGLSELAGPPVERPAAT